MESATFNSNTATEMKTTTGNTLEESTNAAVTDMASPKIVWLLSFPNSVSLFEYKIHFWYFFLLLPAKI